MNHKIFNIRYEKSTQIFNYFFSQLSPFFLKWLFLCDFFWLFSILLGLVPVALYSIRFLRVGPFKLHPLNFLNLEVSFKTHCLGHHFVLHGMNIGIGHFVCFVVGCATLQLFLFNYLFLKRIIIFFIIVLVTYVWVIFKFKKVMLE